MGATLTAEPAVVRDRRRSPRIDVGASAGVVRLRLPPGREAVLLNLCRGGACIEASSALLPGRSVDLAVSLPGWNWRGRATVLRCRVSALVFENGVRYEAAVQFELPLGPDGPARVLEAVQLSTLQGYDLPARDVGEVHRWAEDTRTRPAQGHEEAERP
jgi:hypothetical protein